MVVLFGSHSEFLEHETGAFHPENAERLDAVRDGIANAHLEEVIVEFEPRAGFRSRARTGASATLFG